MSKHELKEKLKDYKLETWRRRGKLESVLVKRDSKGRIVQWLTSKDLANIDDIPEIVIHPLKNFGVKKAKQPYLVGKQPNKPKKRRIVIKVSNNKQIVIKLSKNLVELLNFLRGRKSLGTLVEELLWEALGRYKTTE